MTIWLVLIVVNIPAFWGLAYLLFRDWDDFYHSFWGIFDFKIRGMNHGWFLVPTRALLWLILCATLVGSEYMALRSFAPHLFGWQ